jgi:hypothetical protein
VRVARLSKSRELVQRVGMATLILLALGLAGALITAHVAKVA